MSDEQNPVDTFLTLLQRASACTPTGTPAAPLSVSQRSALVDLIGFVREYDATILARLDRQ